ncbi:MAG TPA: sulfatase-like hydrolase/transferase [Candidatus Acidoferrum sp.]|nr:sulfatase-like hydrolase/transferase [Candidatus Acidoferrum sp.]
MNILLITTDQQRADSLGVYGNKICRTPNLDSLAAKGTRFTACRCQNPYCQPSRATILTGTYPSTHGVTTVGVDLPADMMERSVAAHLKSHGFKTAMFGKAHLASAFPTYPTRQIESIEGSALVDAKWSGPYAGFDHAELVLFGKNIRQPSSMGAWNWCFGPPPFGLHYARFLYRDGDKRGRERLRLMQPEAARQKWESIQTWHNALPEEDHSSTWTADRAVDWLGKVDGRFFAWVSFCDPHPPMDPPATWSTMYSPLDVEPAITGFVPGELQGKPPIHRAWAGGLRGTPFEYANPGGGRLSREELAIMTAAYYGMVSLIDAQVGRILSVLEERKLADDTLVIFASDHGELLGDHGQLFKGPVHYEGLLRVPLIARGGPFKAGKVSNEPVGLVDLAPTMVSAAGLKAVPAMEGRPLLDGTREYVLTENDHDAGFRISVRTLTTKRYKVTTYVGSDGAGELYDLQEDPQERNNLWAQPPAWKLQSDLLALLDESQNRSVRSEPKVSVVG